MLCWQEQRPWQPHPARRLRGIKTAEATGQLVVDVLLEGHACKQILTSSGIGIGGGGLVNCLPGCHRPIPQAGFLETAASSA